jgi:hypothetical protein
MINKQGDIMEYIRTISFVLIIAFLLSAMAVVVGGDVTEEEKANVFGFVHEGGTDLGIPALIQVNPVGGDRIYSVETREDGRFRLYLPPGEYTYEASAREYQDSKGKFLVGDEEMRLNIEMEKVSQERYKVGGKVTDAETGEGLIAGIHFKSDPGVSEGMRTERDGTFSLILPAGRYYYSVESEGYHPFEGKFALTGDLRLPIKLEKMDDRVAGSVKGRVSNQKGDPIPRAGIIFIPMMERDPVTIGTKEPPIPEPPRLVSDEGGNFAIRLPFGAYEMHVEAEGFQPYVMPVFLSPREPRISLRVVMEPLNPAIPLEGCVINFEMTDRNSDGLPDHILLTVDMNDDGTPEAEYEYTDGNSDGNPETVRWNLNVDPALRERIVKLIMKLVEFRMENGPIADDWSHLWMEEDTDVSSDSDGSYYGDDLTDPMDGIVERMDDEGNLETEEEPASSEEENDDAGGEIGTEVDASEKGSEGNVPVEILAVAGIIVLICISATLAVLLIGKK